MCGIAGQFNFQRGEPSRALTIVRMARSIAHRGPDDEGFFIAGPVGLGFRRLSIIDLASGHQPMSDAEETVWIIFNGEIYNYRNASPNCKVRAISLERIRHGSDGARYKEWGTAVFNHFNSMFGLHLRCLEQRLVVARDAMGIKLVYYRLADRQLSFGSEIRAVLAADDTAPQVDASALSLFLRFRYTPSPCTIFQGVRKLAPGSLFVVEKGKCREERWYNYVPTPFATPKKDKEAVAELLDLYKHAYERHLLGDLPVGILLSGGVDSGLLLALMNEHGGSWPG